MTLTMTERYWLAFFTLSTGHLCQNIHYPPLPGINSVYIFGFVHMTCSWKNSMSHCFPVAEWHWSHDRGVPPPIELFFFILFTLGIVLIITAGQIPITTKKWITSSMRFVRFWVHKSLILINLTKFFIIKHRCKKDFTERLHSCPPKYPWTCTIIA